MSASSHHLPPHVRHGLTAVAAVLGLCTGFAAEKATPAPPPAAAEAEPPIYQAPENVAELLKLNLEMRAFFEKRLFPHRTDGTLLQDIVTAIVRPEGLGFAYDGKGTFDAGEAFRRRRGNCLSFALLVTSVARAYGYRTSFQNVELPTRWDRIGDIIASVQHVNVRVETDDGPYIIDLRPDLVPAGERLALRAVADERVFAFFYSDVGFFHLVHGRTGDAMRAMVLATQVDPSSASTWANRATLHARLGDLTAARSCYEKSLKLDRHGMNALVGFVSVLERLGTAKDLRTARELERRAQQLRDRNPFYHQYLAQLAEKQVDWNSADKHLRRAIALKNDEPDFYDDWSNVLRQLGREDEAKRATAKFEELKARQKPGPTRLVP